MTLVVDNTSGLKLVNLFHQLGPEFYSVVEPTPLNDARVVQFNHDLGRELGLQLDETSRASLTGIFNGELQLGESRPIASLYAGHQFGVWVNQLGDGRAAMLGQIETALGRYEIHSKGCGPTPYSRHADGRAVLRSSIREYLASEAMHGLGIPTTRALALLDSTTPVYRERVERGAILIRAADSHLRFGHFEVFAARKQSELVAQLADHLIDHYIPRLRIEADPYAAMYREVVLRTAKLLARWQAVGFCHGVMNTDNMSILGLTIDYGPYGFMEAYDPNHICNHSDQGGRYAYANQPGIAHWNLACLGNALLTLIDTERAQEILNCFAEDFNAAYDAQLSAKLGLARDHPDYPELRQAWWRLMEERQPDFTRAFRLLAEQHGDKSVATTELNEMFAGSRDWQSWRNTYLRAFAGPDAEQRQQNMLAANPLYVLRNSFAQKAIEDAESGDYDEIERLHRLLKTPCVRQSGAETYERPAPDADQVLVSCSS